MRDLLASIALFQPLDPGSHYANEIIKRQPSSTAATTTRQQQAV